MSYGRNPHYIWSDGERTVFGTESIPNNILDAFLYRVFLKCHREDLIQRLKNGKKEWQKQIKVTLPPFATSLMDVKTEYIKTDEDTIRWLEKQEDELLKSLIGKDVK